MVEKISENTLMIISIILMILGITVITFKIVLNYDNNYYYEYIDLFGNKGTTNGYCNYDSLGGQGAMVCDLDDGTVMQVSSYKYTLKN